MNKTKCRRWIAILKDFKIEPYSHYDKNKGGFYIRFKHKNNATWSIMDLLNRPAVGSDCGLMMEHITNLEYEIRDVGWLDDPYKMTSDVHRAELAEMSKP